MILNKGDSGMYKILNSQGLGVAGKQNELIELALTHDFHGVEVDIVIWSAATTHWAKSSLASFCKAQNRHGNLLPPCVVGGVRRRLPGLDCQAGHDYRSGNHPQLQTLLRADSTSQQFACVEGLS